MSTQAFSSDVSGSLYIKLHGIATKPEKIFKTHSITIKITYIQKDSEVKADKSKYDYIINSLETTSEDDYMKSLVGTLNNKIEHFSNKNNYKDNPWSLFYLLKEIIKQLSYSQDQPYNYFRGQNKSWVTSPAIYRNLTLSPMHHKRQIYQHKEYYKNFEYIYKDISKRFPSKINYHAVSNTTGTNLLDARADQLAILQHYGLKTALLDITENPYIGMLFMVSTAKSDDIIYKPQLECYKLNYDSPLFYEAKKLEENQRIRAQKGAFLNYDALLNYCSEHEETGNFCLDSDTFNKIERVIITLEIDFESSIARMKKELDGIDNTVEDSYAASAKRESLQSIIDEMSLIYVKNEDGDYQENEEKAGAYYKVLAQEISEKLNQYNYFYDDLFPDLIDYIERGVNNRYY